MTKLPTAKGKEREAYELWGTLGRPEAGQSIELGGQIPELLLISLVVTCDRGVRLQI